MEELDFLPPKRIVGKMISVDVLDKIKADVINIADGRRSIPVRSVMKIIDKYKGENEDK